MSPASSTGVRRVLQRRYPAETAAALTLARWLTILLWIGLAMVGLVLLVGVLGGVATVLF